MASVDELLKSMAVSLEGCLTASASNASPTAAQVGAPKSPQFLDILHGFVVIFALAMYLTIIFDWIFFRFFASATSSTSLFL
jgi:hypothetical protein